MAREFLVRLKSGIDQDAAPEQRPSFHEKENHVAVNFQQPSEQYTPWKDLETEKEKPEPLEDRPTTWAEALRRKQNLANGISEVSQVLKGMSVKESNRCLAKIWNPGPAKPKLVARAPGSDTSPWKVKKDAPKISAKEVPGDLRPFMSCVLWRLHESIDRNDANQLFLLSDQPEMREVARKLNITTRSTKEFKETVASRIGKANLDAFGELEREFGTQTSKGRNSTVNGMTTKAAEDFVPQDVNRDILGQEALVDDSTLGDGTAKTDESHVIDNESQTQLDRSVKELSYTSTQDEGSSAAKNDDEKKSPVEDALARLAITLVEDKSFEKSTWSIRSPRRSVNAVESHEFEERQGISFPVGVPKTNGERNITTADILENKIQETLGDSPKPALTIVPGVQPEAAKPSQLADQPISGNTTPFSANNAIHTPPSGQVAEEPEDSDEEVVVFRPQAKRLSAQQKPPQQIPRPSAVTDQLQQEPLDFSPNSAVAVTQSQAKPANQGLKPSKMGSHVHPRPTSSLPVIDPDTFGRSLVVQPNRSPRALHNPRSHHYSRPNLQNPQAPQNSRTSPRRHNMRTSPAPHPSPEYMDGSNTTPEPDTDGMATSRPDTTHRRSHQQRLKASQPEPSEGQGPDAQAPLSETQARAPGPRVFESSDFDRRTLPRGMNPQQRGPRPRIFEPSDFVPRTRPPEPLFKQSTREPESIEPRASMPDVQYVLKSGSTRAATRGRGKLWTP